MYWIKKIKLLLVSILLTVHCIFPMDFDLNFGGGQGFGGGGGISFLGDFASGLSGLFTGAANAVRKSDFVNGAGALARDALIETGKGIKYVAKGVTERVGDVADYIGKRAKEALENPAQLQEWIQNDIKDKQAERDALQARKLKDQNLADVVDPQIKKLDGEITAKEKLLQDVKKLCQTIIDIDKNLENNPSYLQHEQLQKQKTQTQEQLKQMAKDYATGAAAASLKNAFGAVVGVANKVIDAQLEANKKAAKAAASAKEFAQQQAETEKYKFDQWMAALTDPKKLMYGGGWALLISGAFFGCRYGLEVLFDEVQRYMNNPTLAQETSLVSRWQRLSNWFWGIVPPVVLLNHVVLEEKLAKRVDILANSVSVTVQNGAYFSNVLFYGPPGTGKTMLGKAIAYKSKLPYIYFAASNFNQFELDEALKVIMELFNFTKQHGEPIVLVIDECEVLFANRDKNLSEETRKILTAFLSYTGTASRDFIIIGLTNRPQDFDEASLSRFGVRIAINAPATEEQKRMLEFYIHKYLLSKDAYKPRSLNKLQQLFGKKPKPVKPPVIDSDALDEEMIAWILENIVGFVGRDIEQLALALQRRADNTPGRCLTREAVIEVVQDQVTQHKIGDTLYNNHSVTVELTAPPMVAAAV